MPGLFIYTVQLPHQCTVARWPKIQQNSSNALLLGGRKLSKISPMYCCQVAENSEKQLNALLPGGRKFSKIAQMHCCQVAAESEKQLKSTVARWPKIQQNSSNALLPGGRKFSKIAQNVLLPGGRRFCKIAQSYQKKKIIIHSTQNKQTLHSITILWQKCNLLDYEFSQKSQG